MRQCRLVPFKGQSILRGITRIKVEKPRCFCTQNPLMCYEWFSHRQF